MRARAIVNLDSGEYYESLAEAASSVGVKPVSLAEAIHKRRKCKNTRFQYFDHFIKLNGSFRLEVKSKNNVKGIYITKNK